ncbi:MFS transporter [Candidatus Woesearchaeota archaeon]|nr:MFS transporter [Candidatus Woesearchaeota archaeon]
MNDYKTGLKSNVWKYFVFEGLWSLVFFFPIFQLFYLARGMTITQIALIGIVFSIARLTMEVPSGVLADRWGRKKTLFLCQIFLIVDMTILIFSQSFWLFLIASLFSGLWIACYSGTGVAFFYDTLKELKREKEYEKLWGKMYMFTATVSFIAAFSAGFLFDISIILPYIFSVTTAFLSLFVIASFTEPKFHRPAEEDSIFLHFKNSIKKIVKNQYIGFIVIFGAILSFSLYYLFVYGQIYLKTIGVPIAFFGIIFAFKYVIEGIGGVSANKIKNKFSYRSIFTFSLLFTIAVIFSLSYLNNYIGVIVFLLSFFIMGMFRIIQRGYIHKRVESHNRATVDSLSSFLIALVAVIFEPIAGKIADIYSIQTSFFVLACVLVIYTLYFIIFKFHKKELFNKSQAP